MVSRPVESVRREFACIPARLVALTGLAAAALAVPDIAVETARFVIVNLLVMAPIIATAVGLAAYARASGVDGLIAKVFAGQPNRMIVVAAVFGAVTPLCGIGVLPVIASLLGAGVPLAPVMAFWLSSPITDPAMLAITAGTIGWAFAITKSAAALAIGLIGGFLTQALQAGGTFLTPLKPEVSADLVSACCDDSCGPSAVRWAFWREAVRCRAFTAEAQASGLLMLKWLTIAFALESILTRYLPAELIARFVGEDSAWAVPVAVAIGTPLYVDGYAALPLVRGLIDLGMAPGAAMAFLISGGITSAYASVAVLALVRLPVFLWYLALAIVGSAMAGYAFELAVTG